MSNQIINIDLHKNTTEISLDANYLEVIGKCIKDVELDRIDSSVAIKFKDGSTLKINSK